MVNKSHVKTLVEQIIAELYNESYTGDAENIAADIADITEADLKESFFVPNAQNKEAYLAMKSQTPARIGIWRAGPRYKTATSLRFRADHASAQDSVFSHVCEDFVKEMGFIAVVTAVKDKEQYIQRPDLGRTFTKETKELLGQVLHQNPTVQIVVGDGLSSAAIEANIKDILPAIAQGLRRYEIEPGPIPFVKYCRVNAMDEIGEITNADVVCMLIGERPGLITAESMSAYIAYKPTVNMPDARRTVISNIHKEGTPPAEAGAHIADLLKTMVDMKQSGVELNLK